VGSSTEVTTLDTKHDVVVWTSDDLNRRLDELHSKGIMSRISKKADCKFRRASNEDFLKKVSKTGEDSGGRYLCLLA
jgi:hypothetical protein